MVLETEPVVSLNGVLVVDVRALTGVVATAVGSVGEAVEGVVRAVLMTTGTVGDGEVSDGAAEANRLALWFREDDAEDDGFSGVLVSMVL